jgi:hypothetical protein
MLSKMVERFIEKSPVTVMARAALENALAPEALDKLFDEKATLGYTRELLFSSVVDLMAVVVCKIEPSINAAYQRVAETLPVSLTSVYNKLNNTEPEVVSALVGHTAARLGPVIREMAGLKTALVPGYRVRIIDGNHLASTQRRLEVLRGSVAGPLPGHALVVLDPELMLATDMIPCEDGHAQERSLTPNILALVEKGDLWIADRNFCTAALLTGIADRDAFYAIRQHAGLSVVSTGTLRKVGTSDTGDVFEQKATIKDTDGSVFQARRIVVRLRTPTRDGDAEVAVITNLPRSVNGSVVAGVYRKRWTLETMFQHLTLMLNAEIDTLAYPRAALLGFSTALCCYNVLSTVQAALRATFGEQKVQEEVSGYYIANEVRITMEGFLIATEPDDLIPFQTMTPDVLAAELLRCAANVRLPKYKRHPRGSKTPVPARTRYRKHTHVSTARLLKESREGSP